MFKVKRFTKLRQPLSVRNGKLSEKSLWAVIETRLDGSEDDYGVFTTKAKADLVAGLLNTLATVSVTS